MPNIHDKKWVHRWIFAEVSSAEFGPCCTIGLFSLNDGIKSSFMLVGGVLTSPLQMTMTVFSYTCNLNLQYRSFQANMSYIDCFFLPGWMLSRIILTCSSLSGRVCSCQNPITWPSSCTTIPNLSQFFPMDIACGPPPLRPTYEQHLQRFIDITINNTAWIKQTEILNISLVTKLFFV